jgi:hypothetical protein
MNGVTRADLIAVLRHTLERVDAVDAAWEGGSAAFDAADELSDVDAVAVVADDAIDTTFAQVEAALHALSPVTLRHDVAATAGYAQKFYRLRDAGEFLVVDFSSSAAATRCSFARSSCTAAARPGSTGAASWSRPASMARTT